MPTTITSTAGIKTITIPTSTTIKVTVAKATPPVDMAEVDATIRKRILRPLVTSL